MSVRLRVPAVEDPDFIAEVELEPAVLRLVGSADTTATRELATLLCALHDELVARHVAEIAVDLRQLDFMAAGCVRELVAWIARLEGAAERYRMRIQTNRSIEWQRHTLPALTCFDTDLVTVE